jgi:Gnt-I system high-affinity gluconate transporter
LMIPIIYSVAYQYKISLIYVGLPMLASLSVMHGFIPPHPSPVALVYQFNADITTTFLYGMVIAIPAIVVAGPLFAKTIAHLPSRPAVATLSIEKPLSDLPGGFNSLLSSILPVVIIGVATLVSHLFSWNENVQNIFTFIAEPNTAMFLTIVIATYTLGIAMGRKLSSIMGIYAEAVKDIAMILLIIGSAGILKQIFIDSGVSTEIAAAFATLHLHPLLLAWIITAVLRLALGSATVAGLTAAGIVYPVVQHTTVEPNLLVLSIGAGSLFCSHVNDTAFWLFKEYFGLSIKHTFRSWTMMETLVSIIGLIGVLILDALIG